MHVLGFFTTTGTTGTSPVAQKHHNVPLKARFNYPSPYCYVQS